MSSTKREIKQAICRKLEDALEMYGMGKQWKAKAG